MGSKEREDGEGAWPAGLTREEYILASAAVLEACEIGRAAAQAAGWLAVHTCFHCGGATRQPPTNFTQDGRLWRFPACCGKCATLPGDPWIVAALSPDA